MMTVRELIKELMGFPEHMEVKREDSEWGNEEINIVQTDKDYDLELFKNSGPKVLNALHNRKPEYIVLR